MQFDYEPIRPTRRNRFLPAILASIVVVAAFLALVLNLRADSQRAKQLAQLKQLVIQLQLRHNAAATRMARLKQAIARIDQTRNAATTRSHPTTTN